MRGEEALCQLANLGKENFPVSIFRPRKFSFMFDISSFFLENHASKDFIRSQLFKIFKNSFMRYATALA